jgi:hypothetical protein
MVLTILQDILMSINLTGGPLYLLALIVVLALLSSPGAMFTMVGLGAKLGLALHLKEQLMPQVEETED